MPAPTFVSASVNAAGTTLAIVFSVNINLGTLDEDSNLVFNPTLPTPARLAGTGGTAPSRTNATLSLTIPKVYQGESVTVSVPEFAVVDAATGLSGNVAASDQPVTNNSTQTDTPAVSAIATHKPGWAIDITFDRDIVLGTAMPVVTIGARVTAFAVREVVRATARILRCIAPFGPVLSGETVTVTVPAATAKSALLPTLFNSAAANAHAVTNNSTALAGTITGRTARSLTGAAP